MKGQKHHVLVIHAQLMLCSQQYHQIIQEEILHHMIHHLKK